MLFCSRVPCYWKGLYRNYIQFQDNDTVFIPSVLLLIIWWGLFMHYPSACIWYGDVQQQQHLLVYTFLNLATQKQFVQIGWGSCMHINIYHLLLTMDFTSIVNWQPSVVCSFLFRGGGLNMLLSTLNIALKDTEWSLTPYKRSISNKWLDASSARGNNHVGF